MVANGLADFVNPTDAELDDAWRSVAARVDPGSGRQVNFIPAEVVTCLCAMRVVDHSRFGSSSALRAPFPIPELARLFKRPNTSVLAKMANLDGSRPNGGRYDREVYDVLTADPSALDSLYWRILSAARRQGVGPDLLPDFLGLIDTVDSAAAVDGSAGTGATAILGSVRWFTGLDGEVIVDDTHVWITRERVSDYPFPTNPRRAPRSAVRACVILPAGRADADGLVHILVEGADALPENSTSHPDAVVFGYHQRREFELLVNLLIPSGTLHPDNECSEVPGDSAPARQPLVSAVALDLDSAVQPQPSGFANDGVASRGLEWFIEEVRSRGGDAARVPDTPRTAVRISVPGRNPVVVRIKSRTGTTWTASSSDQDPRVDDTGAAYWVFVDLNDRPRRIYVLPNDNVREAIREVVSLQGARSPRGRKARKVSVNIEMVRVGRDRWDLLGLPR
ncbi:hypothetical protein GCM10023094_24770 [Rhodococcus olei]|uniref:Uncharacterized protein n=1 Tax=Rhodococcus olei TaxID=2161675 RepID=A0ABP8P0P8_9NOCA